MKRILAMISGICGVLVGVIMLICAFADLTMPKPLTAVFAIACLTNAALIITNARGKQ